MSTVTNERATGRDVILAIGENMRSSLEPLVTKVIAPSRYQVYLHADDYDRLRSLFGELESETRRRLDAELARLNRGSQPVLKRLMPVIRRKGGAAAAAGRGRARRAAAVSAPRYVSAEGRWTMRFQEDSRRPPAARATSRWCRSSPSRRPWVTAPARSPGASRPPAGRARAQGRAAHRGGPGGAGRWPSRAPCRLRRCRSRPAPPCRPPLSPASPSTTTAGPRPSGDQGRDRHRPRGRRRLRLGRSPARHLPGRLPRARPAAAHAGGHLPHQGPEQAGHDRQRHAARSQPADGRRRVAATSTAGSSCRTAPASASPASSPSSSRGSASDHALLGPAGVPRRSPPAGRCPGGALLHPGQMVARALHAGLSAAAAAIPAASGRTTRTASSASRSAASSRSIDGVGGESGGEVAARIAREVLRARLSRRTTDLDRLVREAIALANRQIYERAQADPQSRPACPAC